MTALSAFADRDVSRETLERLGLYEALLRKWNPAINLVSRTTLDAVWDRHFRDSVQVFDLAPKTARHWADLGSGGGFPGLVAAILAADEAPEMTFTLVESDGRKAAFLQAVARETGVAVAVRAERIEEAPPLSADIVTARALAPLARLLGLADRHMATGGTAMFPKGANFRDEVQQALESWRFSYQTMPSVTEPGAVVLAIGGISRV